MSEVPPPRCHRDRRELLKKVLGQDRNMSALPTKTNINVFRDMLLVHFIWLLLCYAQWARSNLLEEYEDISKNIISAPNDESLSLPVELGQDSTSGCICRASANHKVVVCFGNYVCKKFPKVTLQSDVLIVRTSVMTEILKSDLSHLSHLKVLKIEANHQLTYLEPGLFQNLTRLQQLSLSYNTGLHFVHKETFRGLINLRNLTLVNNGFTDIKKLTVAFRPSILPSLRGLDLSENSFEQISENSFWSMKGTPLRRLEINLCRLEFIHSNSLLPLQNLKVLRMRENELNASLIGELLKTMMDNNINLTHLDLSGLGFRKRPPWALMDIIAKTTIQRLCLSDNQFEIISDDAFPRMVNIEVLDLRKVYAISISQNAFEPAKFPNLRVLFLGGNNLPGIHQKHIHNQQLLILDLSHNRGSSESPLYYEIDREAFIKCNELRVLNLAYNGIKSIFNYTFTGLEKLKILNLENGTIFYIGDGTFKPLKSLEMLNLANNPLSTNRNLTSAMFQGLNELKILILKNCGIKRLNDDDNIFEMMPNLTHLILKNNQLYYITSETLKPMKMLKVLDLSENLIMSWWKPLFLASGVHPSTLYLTNNKISHFTINMIQDINYLLENVRNTSVDIDFMDNVFICDCNSMYKTYMWLQVNGSDALKRFFVNSKFQCTSPDVWEDRRVADYLSSIKRLQCLVYKRISSLMILMWTAPSLVTIITIFLIIYILYRYRIYIRYWIFLTKVALGKRLMWKVSQVETQEKVYKYDAFVSYCNEDRDFVAEMILQLESTPPYFKLCIYERDFEIGAFISESVSNSINDSRYIILVVSNSFARSHWCRWEMHLAEYHRLFLNDGTKCDPLVLIKLGEVENKYLTASLKYLLKTKIYHLWNDSQPEEFWKKLRTVLAKSK